MRILLQHARTQLYLQGLGIWTANPHDAMDFRQAQRAIDFARDHSLQGVQVAITFTDHARDEFFPLPARYGAHPVKS